MGLKSWDARCCFEFQMSSSPYFCLHTSFTPPLHFFAEAKQQTTTYPLWFYFLLPVVLGTKNIQHMLPFPRQQTSEYISIPLLRPFPTFFWKKSYQKLLVVVVLYRGREGEQTKEGTRSICFRSHPPRSTYYTSSLISLLRAELPESV